MSEAHARKLLQAHPQVDAKVHDVDMLLQRCKVYRLNRGGVLCREGAPGTTLFVLLEGSIEVTKRDVAGVERAVGEVQAPTFIGQMGTIDRARRTATCVGATDCLVAAMDQGTFQQLAREISPQGAALRRLLLSSLTRQLLHGNHRLRVLLDAGQATQDDFEDSTTEFLRAAVALEGWTDGG